MLDARGAAPVPAAAALVGSLLLAGPAEAQPETVRISWVRGPGAHGCAGPARIAEQVTARLGHSPFAVDALRSIDVYVTRAGGAWRAEIYVRGRNDALSGVRELTSEAEDCGPIEAASVLAMALAIDPDAGTRPPPPPSPSPSPTSPTSAPSARAFQPGAPYRGPAGEDVPLPAPLPAWAPPPEPARGWAGGAGAAIRAGVGVGLLPKAAAAVSIGAEVSVARAVHVTGAALWMPEVHAADARFSFGLAAFSLGTCGDVAGNGRVGLTLCGALWAGALHGVVYALTPVDPGQHPWVAVEATARLRVRLVGPLHAELGLPAVVPVVRPPFTVTGFPQPVFQQTPVTTLPTAGLGARFP